MKAKTILSKIHRGVSLALLPTALAFTSTANAQMIEATKVNYAEKIYKRFSEIQNGDVRFETKVLRSGNLNEIADRPLATVIIRPEFKIILESNGTELKLAQPDSKELNLVMADTTGTITPDMLKTGGLFRVIEVTSHLGSNVTRHMTLELCSNADDFCFLVDPTMAYLENVVYAFNESTLMFSEALINAASNSTEARDDIGATKAASCVRGGANVFQQDLPFRRGDYMTGGVAGTAEGFNYTYACTISNGRCELNSSATVPISNFYHFGNVITNIWKARCDKLDLREAKWRSGSSHYTRAVAITGCGVKQGGTLSFDYTYSGSGTTFNYNLSTSANSTYYRGGLFQRYCAYSTTN